MSRAILVALLALFAVVPSAAKTPPTEITVAIDDSYPPYIFRNNEGKLQGIRYDMWQLWSAKTGITVHLLATEWAKAQKTMREGGADVIDTLFTTPERVRRYHFSKPYATLDVSAFMHQTISGIAGVENLRGFAVGVKEGDATIEWLRARGINNFRKYPSYEALILAARNGEVRVYCMDRPPALYWLYKYGLEKDFRYTAPLYSGKFHWATRKENAALHTLVADGFDKISEAERQKIETKWLGASLHTRSAHPYLKYGIYALLFMLGVAGFLLLLNWTLRRKVASRTSELMSTLDALRSSERYNRMLFENTMLGLRLSRMDGVIIDANQAFADIIGTPLSEVVGMTVQQITPEEYRDIDARHTEILLRTGYDDMYDKEYFQKSGKRVPVRVTATLIERDGEHYVLSTVEDISAQKAAAERINFLAMHDALTGLPNRVMAQDRFKQAVAHADRGGGKVALLLLDLDNFKAINDTLGPSMGDSMLKAVASRLSACLHGAGAISRQGGDEFLIVLPSQEGAGSVTGVLERLIRSLDQPFVLDGYELSTSVSVGAAFYPDDGRDFDTLLKHADIAMYHAKDFGRNTYRFFDEKMQAGVQDHMKLANDLRRALERDELRLHYQPQIDLESGRVLGAEALLRWAHPEMGMISPTRFIPVAEGSGLIVPIGQWVLREACRQAVAWQREGWPDFQIAVNLSAVQFKRDDLEHSVLEALESSQMDPALLELELTESILLNDTENVLEKVRRLKSFGVKLSIDDFGTGYSSLAYLKHFAVDKLKIDRSFVSDVTIDPEDSAIVRAVIQMAKSLGLRTIAEGVEDEKTAEWLHLFKCNEAQGYYFARPMDASAFGEYLASVKDKT